MSSHASFEQRLKLVESQLGLDVPANAASAPSATTPSPSSNSISKDKDSLLGRVSSLEHRYHSLLHDSQHQPLRAALSESTQLLADLDPGTALTHQQQIAAPLLYRRQELLACKESFQNDLDEAARILSLLLIGQDNNVSSLEKNSKGMPEQRVVQAPIVTGTRVSDAQKQQLASLEQSLEQISQRAQVAADRVDQMVEQYHALLHAISIKTVRLDEILKERGV